jgi:hypothetical protein
LSGLIFAPSRAALVKAKEQGMDAGKQPNDDGLIHIQRLTPGKVDIVLGAHPGKRKVVQRAKGRSHSSLLIVLALLGFCAYLLFPRAKTEAVLPTIEPPVAVAAQEPPQALIETPALPAPATAAEPYLGPNVVRHELPPASVQPLDECMKNGNVIDENVLNCRFGQVPRAAEREPAKGMVSSSYMANYKSDTARTHTERPNKAYSVTSVSFRAIDSRSRYHADFRVFNNRIENNSVCMNFTKGSVENRECRRAAVVFFKESCQEWTRRAAKDRDEQSKLTQERYCEANRTFEAG